MKSRAQYEDIFHDMIASMLPNFKKSDIRIAYQFNEGLAGDVIQPENYQNRLEGFTNTQNFIYLYVTLDSNSLRSIETNDGTLSVTRMITLHISCYGEDSSTYALIINSLMRTQTYLDYVNSQGLFLYNDTESDSPSVYEDIHGQWWERHDVTIIYNEGVSLNDPSDGVYKEALAMQGKLIIDGEERGTL